MTKIDPSVFIMANQFGWCEGRIVQCVLMVQPGSADLESARHYLGLVNNSTKYQRALRRIRQACRFSAWWHDAHDALNVDEFIRANGIKNPRAGVIRHIAWWNNAGQLADLEGARKWLDELIALESGHPPAGHVKHHSV